MTVISIPSINKEIDLYLTSLSNHSLYEPIKYIMGLDGKRIRPSLFFDAVKTFGGNPSEYVPLALSIELFHNFTLLHDDLMDKSSLRRGKQTVHEKWNANSAILSGDAMMILAYQCLDKIPTKHQPNILKSFNKMALKLCEGQQYDMDFENQDFVSIEDYITMIQNKTSVLLAFCLEAAAIVSEVDEKTTQLISQFGIHLGIAFQLQDDMLDLYPKSEKMGKEIGGDIKNKKKALPLLIALNNPASREKTSMLIQHQSNNIIQEIKTFFQEYNVKEQCEEKISTYYRKAKDNLMQIEGYDTKIFFDFCDTLLNRVN